MSKIDVIRGVMLSRLRGVSAGAVGVLFRLVEIGREHDDYVLDVCGDKVALALACRLNCDGFMRAVDELRKAGLVRVNRDAGYEVALKVLLFSGSQMRRMKKERARLRRLRGCCDG